MSIRLGGDERRPASTPRPRIRTDEVFAAGRLLAARIRSAVTGRNADESARAARLQHAC